MFNVYIFVRMHVCELFLPGSACMRTFVSVSKSCFRESVLILTMLSSIFCENMGSRFYVCTGISHCYEYLCLM